MGQNHNFLNVSVKKNLRKSDFFCVLSCLSRFLWLFIDSKVWLINCSTEESNYKGVSVGVVSKSISLCGAVGINNATSLFVFGCSCGEPGQEAGPYWKIAERGKERLFLTQISDEWHTDVWKQWVTEETFLESKTRSSWNSGRYGIFLVVFVCILHLCSNKWYFAYI